MDKKMSNEEMVKEAVEEAKKLQKTEEKDTVVVCFGSLSFMKELYQIMGE